MPFSISIAVDPEVRIETPIQIQLTSPSAAHLIPIGLTPYREDTFSDPLPPNSKLGITVITHKSKPVALEARAVDQMRIDFRVHPGLRIAGKISHLPIAFQCQVSCLNDGKSAGPGECVECENDDAIVELCC